MPSRSVPADTLLDNLTVYEQLLYTSELKNSQKESLARKKERVDLILDQLALDRCKDVTIGSALKRGISGKAANWSTLSCQVRTETFAREHNYEHSSHCICPGTILQIGSC